MDTATITNGTLLLHKVNGDAVATANPTYDSRRAFLTPSSSLEPGTQYRLTILGGENGVKTVTGTSLAASKTYEFTTTHDVLITAPRALSVADNDGHLTISWLAPSEYDISKTPKYEVYITTDGLEPAPGNTAWPLATDAIGTITNTSIGVGRHLSPADYTVQVRGYIDDLKSPWATLVYRVESPTSSSTPPTTYSMFEVAATYPKTDDVNIMPDSIKILFTDNVDTSTVTSNTVYVVNRKKPASLNILDLMTDYAPSKSIPFSIDALAAPTNIISLTINPENLVQNSEYTVIVRESIKSASGDSLGEIYSWSFNSELYPLYGDAEIIREDIKSILTNIPDKVLYKYMQVASQTALEKVQATQAELFDQETFDENVPRYVNEYVRTAVAYELIVNAALEHGMKAGLRKLGDLQIETTSEMGSIPAILSRLKERIKPWLDELHGHHNRGYAKPGVTVRGENVEPYPDFFTRTELKDLEG